MSRLLRIAALSLAAQWASPVALAWDPASTHQGMLDAAVLRSTAHVRMMDASELKRGLFTPVRVDPHRLKPDELRLILDVVGRSPDDGALPLGGPGACPGADAPAETQVYCASGDLWELSALGWMRFGVIAETSPSARLAHHFLARNHPGALHWRDPEVAAAVLRWRSRRNGEPLAGAMTGTNFDAHQTPTAIAWLSDDLDPIAPARLIHHLRRASFAVDRGEREHHFALAMICLGALSHVLQDLSVPAHARGDATAFFARLSPTPGDLGLPLQEFARTEFGRRDLPLALPLHGPDGIPLARDVRGLILGEGAWSGLAPLASRRFFSESTLPPSSSSDAVDSVAAARSSLGDAHGLDPDEVEGATLTPWPADRGYLRSATGRALAAWIRDREGRVHFHLDRAVYREQALRLIPAAIDVTRSLLDLVWPAWPGTELIPGVLELSIPAGLKSPELHILHQDAAGRRSSVQVLELRPGETSRVVGIPGAGSDPDARIVLVLVADAGTATPYVVERVIETLENTSSRSVPIAPQQAS